MVKIFLSRLLIIDFRNSILFSCSNFLSNSKMIIEVKWLSSYENPLYEIFNISPFSMINLMKFLIFLFFLD